MTDFNGDFLLSSLPATQGTPDAHGAQGTQIFAGEGGLVTKYFRMRGVDNGTSTYTTWTATGSPDPNGAQATAGNTTPTLVGTIVAASGIVLSAWES